MSQSPVTRSLPVSEQHRWRAYWICVGVAALTILDLSKVNVGLPSIEAAFDASATQLQLIVAGYVLTFGLTLVPAGRIGDQRSRKTLFVTGLSLFLVTSLVAAIAPNITVLLVARLLQGVAAGIQMPQVLGIIQELFRGAERGKAFGLFGAVIGLATAFGPTLGGLMIAIGGPTDGWRGIFLINVPLVIVALVLAIWFLPVTRRPSNDPLSLDPVGLTLFAVTVIALMWPFLFTTGSPSDNPARWWVLVVFVLALIGFLAWERRYAASGSQPLVPLALFGVASFRNGISLASVYFAAMPSMFLLTTLYLQDGLGLEAVFAGMVSIGFALVSALSSWIGGNLVNRLGRPLVVAGLVLLLVGIALLVLVAITTPPEITPWAMAGAMAIAGAGGGLVVSPNQTLTLMDIPVRQGGLAGSVGQLGQRIGTAIGTAVTLSLFYSTIYRESDGKPDLAVYHHAYGYGMLAVAVLIAVAFGIGVADLGSRRRRRGQEGTGPVDGDDAAAVG